MFITLITFITLVTLITLITFKIKRIMFNGIIIYNKLNNIIKTIKFLKV